MVGSTLKTDWALLAGELLIMVLVGLGVAFVHRLFLRHFRYDVLSDHNEVAGWIFSGVGVIYAVLLGFIVVVVWQKFDAAANNVQSEVSAVSDTYRAVQGYPDPLRSKIRNELNSYMKVMMRYEWPAMEHGRYSNEALDVMEQIAYDINTFKPRDDQESNAQQAAMAQEQRLFDARRLRLQQIQPSVPVVLWFALTAGAIALIGMAFLFGVERKVFHFVMTGTLAAVIALLFIIIAEFDRPFSGAAGVDMDGWYVLSEHLTHVK